MTWTIVDSKGALSGNFVTKGLSLAGDIRGTRSGDTLEFIVSFRFPDKNCGGTLQSKGEVANGGKFIEGTLLVKSNCSDHDEPGTWIMRPGK